MERGGAKMTCRRTSVAAKRTIRPRQPLLRPPLRLPRLRLVVAAGAVHEQENHTALQLPHGQVRDRGQPNGSSDGQSGDRWRQQRDAHRARRAHLACHAAPAGCGTTSTLAFVVCVASLSDCWSDPMAGAEPTLWGSGAYRRRQSVADDLHINQSCPGDSEHPPRPPRPTRPPRPPRPLRAKCRTFGRKMRAKCQTLVARWATRVA